MNSLERVGLQNGIGRWRTEGTRERITLVIANKHLLRPCGWNTVWKLESDHHVNQSTR